MIADTEAQLSDFKLGEKVFQFLRYEIKKKTNFNQKFKKSFDLIAESMQIFVNHILVYYDSPLPIGSDEIIKTFKCS